MKESYIYVLISADRGSLKIGKSDNPIKRATILSKYYEFNFFESFYIRCDESNFEIETMLHKIFKKHHIHFDYDGGNEFFKYDVLDDILALIKIFEKYYDLKKYKFKLKKQDIVIEKENQIFSSIGESIKNRRLFLDINQQELAESCDVNRRTILNLERGQGSLKNLVRVMIVLGIENKLEKLFENKSLRKRASK